MTHPKQPPAHVSPKWLSCNGRQFRRLAQASLASLELHYEHVNALNVFPVPDGDTGTNMLLTMRSAYRRIKDTDETHVGKVAQELAQGALMGARGNSGVILSQILRGMANSLQDKKTFTAEDLAKSLQSAADTAYSGVMRPVEGTILTVIKEAAAEGHDAARKSQDLRFIWERVLERAQQALERTPEQLPILKQAGVVDSGGQGLVYLFLGMARYVQGDDSYLQQVEALTSDKTIQPAQALVVPESGNIENPYDVQFILMGENLNVIQVRQDIDAMGDSTVVVGDERTIKVHIHVEDPGEPLSYGIKLGKITDVVVENMQMQMEEIVASPPRDRHNRPPDDLDLQPDQIGVVAVAPGQGLADILRSLGVAHVVDGGQTNNPSTEELLNAVNNLPTNNVIILPNNKNIFLAAQTTVDLTDKAVAVIPTRTFPQGISAMLSFNLNGTLDEVSAAMEQTAKQVITGEITIATKSVTINDVQVEEGQIIGLCDGQLCTANSDLQAVVTAILEKMEAEDAEIISLYYGADVTAADAQEIADFIEEQYPEVEVELFAGGQPHYAYILGAE
ncbi:MAG TPA: DAK2 domain-containing protein [Anaerolineae bacterium]|nr:DAK2 domain-containing protein [Anaerolineae bacterium]